MMQLRFVATADNWARELCESCSAYVMILGVKPTFEGRTREVAHFVDIKTKNESEMTRVRDWLRRSNDVRSTEITNLAGDHMMGVVIAKGCGVCTTLIDTHSASFISSAVTEADCTVVYKVFLSRVGVPILLNRLSASGVAYKVIEISVITRNNRLTTRQFGVLKSAMESGLFDYPKRITQDELATKLGVSSSNLNEILRRAEKKILTDFLDGGLPTPVIASY